MKCSTHRPYCNVVLTENFGILHVVELWLYRAQHLILWLQAIEPTLLTARFSQLSRQLDIIAKGNYRAAQYWKCWRIFNSVSGMHCQRNIGVSIGWVVLQTVEQSIQSICRAI